VICRVWHIIWVRIYLLFFKRERERERGRNKLFAISILFSMALTLLSFSLIQLFIVLLVLLGCGPTAGCPMDYKGKEFDQVWQIKYVYRKFLQDGRPRKHHKDNKKHWDVFGSVQYEHFDPLAFSKQVGDYPSNGTPSGARWAKTMNVKLYD
jgi:hypothetical protein